MGRLTTHVLDTAQGRPGAGIKIDLYSVGTERKRLAQATTNADGRCDRPLLEGDGLKIGAYELVFHVGPYFSGSGLKLAEPPFLDEVVIRFGVASADEHYHVPLLLSPYGYSTYRGS